MMDLERSGKKQIAVIGGGASGCMAAIAAAQAGGRVFLIEKNDRIARKIYATGNGRCNLTNLFLDGTCYHTGGDPAGEGGIFRILSWIERFSQEDLTAFFHEEGVLFHDRDGWVYPRTDQAETIARALEKRMRALGIRILLNASVQSIRRETPGGAARGARGPGIRSGNGCGEEEGTPGARGNGAPGAGGKLSVRIELKAAGRPGKKGRGRADAGSGRSETLLCDAAIVCTGGLAGPAFGCGGDGYRFAAGFGHSLRKPLPALTQLVCGSPFLKRAAGVRCQARISLYLRGGMQAGQAQDAHIHPDTGGLLGSPIASETGELQITENCLSGIPAFQLSAAAARCLDAGGELCAVLDFLPEFTREAYAAEIAGRLSAGSRDQMLADLFLGLAPRKVLDLVLASEGLQAEMKAKRFSDGELRRLMLLLRAFALPVEGVSGFDKAQVTSGGIPLEEVDDGFGSVLCPGLYFAGEVLDVDGRCGGYNLQWAMTSGALAGRASAGCRPGDLQDKRP